MVIKDVLRNVVLWHKYVRHENIGQYVEGVEWLKRNGFRIYGIVVDGMKRLPQALKPIPVQMCQFHQTQIVRRYLTQNPDIEASQKLLDLINIIARTDKESLSVAFKNGMRNIGTLSMNGFTIRESSVSHLSYMWPKLRSAYLSIKRNIPLLWTFSDHPETGFPNTNNALEPIFSHLKTKVRVHWGISKEHRKN